MDFSGLGINPFVAEYFYNVITGVETPHPFPRSGICGWVPIKKLLLRVLSSFDEKLTKIRFELSIGKLKQNLSLEYQKTTNRAPVGA